MEQLPDDLVNRERIIRCGDCGYGGPALRVRLREVLLTLGGLAVHGPGAVESLQELFARKTCPMCRNRRTELVDR